MVLLSGFTFIRNALQYDFPVLEAIESALPIVDEFIVNVGQSDDKTEELLESISSPKIKIIKNVWDDQKTKDGLVLSEQTNIALAHCQGKWALYLQADEALHESEHDLIRSTLEKDDQQVDGFRFRYLHFYGGYTLIQRTRQWYASEVRILRKDSKAQSFGDAQTFRGPQEQVLNTKLLDAHIFHYGHARKPNTMLRKIHYFHRFWHGDQHDIQTSNAYHLKPKELVWFWGSHPVSYNERVALGLDWSPRPKNFMHNVLKMIVIVASGSNWELALELKTHIQKNHPEYKIFLCSGFWEWSKLVFQTMFRRSSSAVVDLNSEQRGFLSFIYWIVDAFVTFKVRIAHAPYGKLSCFQSFFYTAVNWGVHEKKEEGFTVPPSSHATQIGCWLGIPKLGSC